MRLKDFSRKFNAKSFGDMVDFLNSVFQNGITIANNFSGQIIEGVILPAAGTEISIPHRLKTVPKYRIILRHSGNGIVVDGPTTWNDKAIYLKNSTSAAMGSEDVTVTILLLRG